MAKITEVYVGDIAQWVSAAGTLVGEVVDIDIALNAKGKMSPWLLVKTEEKGLVRLCGTEGYLKMMKFRVLERVAYAA